MSVSPTASVRNRDYLNHIRHVVAERGLVGLANNTKWNELVVAINAREGYRPVFRWKDVDSNRTKHWDRSWPWHLPYLFVSVEWFDLKLICEVHQGRLVPPRRIDDHSDWVEAALDRIGFDWVRHGDVARIFGYAPRSMEGLD